MKADFADSSNLVKKSNLESKRYFVICEREIVNQNLKMYFLDTFLSDVTPELRPDINILMTN